VRSDASGPARALASIAVRPRKSRGQNFLVQPAIADRIVAALEVRRGDTVIEIGPGLGILTDRLVQQPLRRLHLIEVDAELSARLADRFRDDARVVVANRDFLRTESSEFTAEAPVRIVGNLPFNIAAAILERLRAYHGNVTRMVLMFQREVAERIRARPGVRAHCALSVFTALYWEIASHFRVAAGSFHPKPDVDAEVLVLTPRPVLPFLAEEEAAVIETVRAAFSAPRKTIRNSLAGGLNIEGSVSETSLKRAAIDPRQRPGTIEVADLVNLARVLGSLTGGERSYRA
jgi:16S rRNA (adenine1518-N6/adenine1519-N6)-dimethyltransferase